MSSKRKNRQSAEETPSLDDPASVEAQPLEGGDLAEEGEGAEGEGDDEGEDLDGDEGLDDEDDGEDDGEDEGEDFRYVVVLKNGVQTFHEDARDPDQLLFDYKLARTFPHTPTSLFTDDELTEFKKLQKSDPRRYGEKTARAFLFEIGDTVLDPGEVAQLTYIPSPEGDDDGGDTPVATAPPSGHDRTPSPNGSGPKKGLDLKNRIKGLVPQPTT